MFVGFNLEIDGVDKGDFDLLSDAFNWLRYEIENGHLDHEDPDFPALGVERIVFTRTDVLNDET